MTRQRLCPHALPFTLVALLWSASSGAAQSPRVSYSLSAILDADNHELHGSGTITLRNTTSSTLNELWFHLYLNAFENDQTLFYRSAFKRARGGGTPSTWGNIELTALDVDGDDVLGSLADHSPDDPSDRTDLRVGLSTPIAAGARARVRVTWTAKLPQLVTRTGFERDFHFLGQWFPKLAKLDDDGTWQHFAFHPYSEFHANFGDYDVSIDVPQQMVVGASGVLHESSTETGRARYQYRAENVHDFAWVAWPEFDEETRRVGAVSVRVLYPPGHERNLDRTWRAIEHGLPYYAQHYGPYPYPSLTVVHPPRFAADAGGMEYPTLITTGGRWYEGWLAQTVEQVTLHELAHQWFYGLVASDEHRWPFLDEGLASYADSNALHSLFGAGSGLSLPGLQVSALAYYRWLGQVYGHDAAVGLRAAEFPTFNHLGALVYGRTTSLLHTWSRVYGPSFDDALQRYAREQHFQSPTPATFLATIGEGIGNTGAEQLRSALFDKGWVDYEVVRLDCVAGGASSDVSDVTDGSTAGSAETYVGRALLVRRGTLQLPVDVELIDATGKRYASRWDGRAEWHQVDYAGESELVGAVIDPQRAILVDQDLTNNARTAKRKSNVSTLGVFTFFTQLLLHWLGA